MTSEISSSNFSLEVSTLVEVVYQYSILSRGLMPHHMSKDCKSGAYKKLLHTISGSNAILAGLMPMPEKYLVELIKNLFKNTIPELPKDRNAFENLNYKLKPFAQSL